MRIGRSVTAQNAPGDEGPDRPREVVVEAHERDVGRRVRIVDQGRLIALTITSQELNSQRKNALTSRLIVSTSRWRLGREEVRLGAVAVVPVGGGVMPGDEGLRPDREAAREHVEVLDGGLHVHQPLARVLVGEAELLRVVMRVTPTHIPPSNGFMKSG